MEFNSICGFLVLKSKTHIKCILVKGLSVLLHATPFFFGFLRSGGLQRLFTDILCAIHTLFNRQITSSSSCPCPCVGPAPAPLSSRKTSLLCSPDLPCWFSHQDVMDTTTKAPQISWKRDGYSRVGGNDTSFNQ